MFDHSAAKGFIELWGLPLKIRAARDKVLRKSSDMPDAESAVPKTQS
jgi:hypothetical protein